MKEKTLSELVECAKREVAMRERVYPRWVEQRKMAEEKAEHEIDCMKSILRILTDKRDDESGQMKLI